MLRKWFLLLTLTALSACVTHPQRCSGPLRAINPAMTESAK